MSQIKAFFEKAMSDDDLMAKLKELGEKDAQDEEIIALAAGFGFTITKADIEKMKNPTTEFGKLNEEDLEKVAGGATKNRWNPNVCPKLTRTRYECVGFLHSNWCDHYRMTDAGVSLHPSGLVHVSKYNHICMMGVFNYRGKYCGEPDQKK